MDEIITTPKAWERMPTETAKQYHAFTVYYSLLPYGDGDEKRSLANVAKKLGLRDIGRMSEWSSGNNWVERALAYDAAMSITAITVRETALADYQQAVVDSLSAQLVLLNNLIETTAKKMKEKVDAGEIDPTGLKKLVEATRVKDDLARRVGRMPTQFRTVDGVEEEPEDIIYTIGG